MAAREEVARDGLRVALQASARERAGAVLEIDSAEEGMREAAATAETAMKDVSEVVGEVRDAKGRREELQVALDLVGMVGGKDLGVERAAEVLRVARGVLEERGAQVLGEEVDEVRERLQRYADGLTDFLVDSVRVRARGGDRKSVRGCVLAARKLGEMTEERVLRAAVGGLLPAESPGSPGGGIAGFIARENRKAEAMSLRYRRLEPSEDGKRAIDSLALVREEAVDRIREFIAGPSAWFPDEHAALLVALELTMNHTVLRTAEEMLAKAHGRQTNGSTSHPLQIGNADAGKEEHEKGTNELNVLVAVSSTLEATHRDFSTLTETKGVSPARVASVMDRCITPLKSRVTMYMKLELHQLQEIVCSLFQEVLRLQSSPFISSSDASQCDDFSRFGMLFLRVASAFPHITGEAVRACDFALQRSSIALNAPNDAALEAAVSLWQIVLNDLFAKGPILVAAAVSLLPTSPEVAASAELWESASSPIAIVCKVVQAFRESGELIDDAMRSLGYWSTPHRLSPMPASSPLPAKGWSGSERNAEREELSTEHTVHCLALRSMLRDGFMPLSTSAEKHLVVAIDAAASRIESMLRPTEEKLYHRVEFGLEAFGETQAFSGEELEPSAPFLALASFLEAQVRTMRAAFLAESFTSAVTSLADKASEIVLKRWCGSPGPIQRAGGRQMEADGIAVAQVFGASASPECGIYRLPCYGKIVHCAFAEVAEVASSEDFPNADAMQLAELIRKRPDGNLFDELLSHLVREG